MFVSEENVDGFLDTVVCPSVCAEAELESQPLIEVLDVSEDRSQIRLKVRISGSCMYHRCVSFSQIIPDLTGAALFLFCLDIAGKTREYGVSASINASL